MKFLDLYEDAKKNCMSHFKDFKVPRPAGKTSERSKTTWYPLHWVSKVQRLSYGKHFVKNSCVS